MLLHVWDFTGGAFARPVCDWVQDNDSLRRGQPTNHVKYGDDVALLAGDALLSYAFEHIARDTQAPAEQIVRVITELGRSVGSVGLVGGQACSSSSHIALQDNNVERCYSGSV